MIVHLCWFQRYSATSRNPAQWIASPCPLAAWSGICTQDLGITSYHLWPTYSHSKSSKGCGKAEKSNLFIIAYYSAIYPSDHHIRLSYLAISYLKTSQTSCTPLHSLASCTQLQFRKSKIRSVPSWPQLCRHQNHPPSHWWQRENNEGWQWKQWSRGRGTTCRHFESTPKRIQRHRCDLSSGGSGAATKILNSICAFPKYVCKNQFKIIETPKRQLALWAKGSQSKLKRDKSCRHMPFRKAGIGWGFWLCRLRPTQAYGFTMVL